MTTRPLDVQQIAYFGKLPARGDFVKGQYNPQLLKVLDDWVAHGMELLAEDPRWKLVYDAASPVSFACLGARSRLVIAGQLRPSRDGSARRYPFLAAVPVQIEAAPGFMAGAPLLLASFWRRADDAIGALQQAEAVDAALHRLESLSPEIARAFGGTPQAQAHADFLRNHSLLRLEQGMTTPGHPVSMHRAILALGMLLQPVAASGATHLEKGLALPLPHDASLQAHAAAFWLDLIAPFVAAADFELLLCLATLQGRPRLLVGFNGLAPRGLLSALDAQACAAHHIEIDDPDWVEASVRGQSGLYKLLSYLDQPQLPLEIVRGTFRETFPGE